MSELPSIVVVKSGAISHEDLERIREAGYLVVTSATDDTDCLSVISALKLPLDGLGIVNAAFWALGQSYPTASFGKKVRELCEKQSAASL